MSTLYLADAPTYASHLAAYPENGAAILALPAGTRRYIEDMQCSVVRSAAGKYWIPDRVPGSRIPKGTAAHWIGPAGVFTITSTTSQTRKLFRPVYYRMPGFRPATVSRISLYQTTAGSAGAGTDSCQMRLYAANPDGSPIENVAPLFVWDWNAAGSGGAGTLSLTNAGNNATRIHADIPGGSVLVPPHFWLGFAHDLATLPPDLSCISNSAVNHEDGYAVPTGSDLGNVLNITRNNGYSWTQAGAWTIGDTQVWPSGTDLIGGNNIVAHLKVV